MSVRTHKIDKICFSGLFGKHENERAHMKYRQNQLPRSFEKDKNERAHVK